MKMEPPLCGSTGGVVRCYLRLRPLRGLCLRLTFGLAATRLPRRDAIARQKSMKMEPPLCGSAGCVVRRYLRLRPLRGLCLRLTLRLAATRLPGAMRLPRRDTAPVSPETMQQHTHAFIHYIRRSRVAAILSARPVQYVGNGL